MITNRSRILPLLTVCAVAALTGGANAKSARAPLPKLQSISPLATAMPGARVPVRLVLKGNAARARLTLLLSRDRRPSRSDRRLGATTVPAVRAHGTLSVTTRVTIPARGKIGSWYLLACMGAGTKPQCSAVPLPVLAKPSPRSVSVATDPAHAATELMTATGGGTLTATGGDGSTYTLTLPAGALASDETITLTPVSRLGGLRAGTPSAGVQIAPDGLTLLRAAALTITPAHAVPVAHQIGYFWHGTGRESGVYPPTRDPHAFTLSLNHFSGYEVVDGNAAARTALSNQPTNVQDRYADLAAAIAAVRAGGDPGRFNRALSDVLRARYESVVKPALAAAADDDSLALSAIGLGMVWEHDVQAYGGSFGAEEARVTAAMLAIAENALRKSIRSCQTRVAFVERILYFARFLETMGGGGPGTTAALDAAQKCLRYRLDFTTSSTEVAGWTFTSTVQFNDLALTAAGANPADPLSDAEAPPVTADLRYTQGPSGAPGSNCSFTFGTPKTVTPLEIDKLQLDSTLREVIDAHGHATFQAPPPSVTLEMLPGNYEEWGTVVCRGDKEGPQPILQKTFTAGWIINHQPELDQDKGRYVLTGWTVSDDGSVAKLSYDRTFTAGDTSERQQSTFTLRHVSGGQA